MTVICPCCRKELSFTWGPYSRYERSVQIDIENHGQTRIYDNGSIDLNQLKLNCPGPYYVGG